MDEATGVDGALARMVPVRRAGRGLLRLPRPVDVRSSAPANETKPMSLITSKRYDPIAIAFGDAPGCKRCNATPLRIEYARNLTTRQIEIVVVCAAHHVRRAIDVERIAAAAASDMTTAIVVELHRVFGDVLAFGVPGERAAARVTQIVRLPITCGACGAPSDPKVAGCKYCGAHLAGASQ